MKVSFFVHDLGGNPIVRIVPIARAFERLGWEVEVVGFLFGGKPVFGPYADLYDYRTIEAKGYIWELVRKVRALGDLASGDIVYAGKPLLSTFLPALQRSAKGRKLPLFLDVEDDDVINFRIRGPLDVLRKMRHLHASGNYVHNAWLRRMVKYCSGVTVSSTKLQGYYGGVRLLHGPGNAMYGCPIGSSEQCSLREQFGLPEERICFFFAGKARKHKGLDLFVQAVADSSDLPFQLVLAGEPSQEVFIEAKERMGGRCSLMGILPHPEIGSLVQACDVGLVLQENTEYAESQIPAKLLEAFQHERPVLATKVGDLPMLVSGSDLGDSRGWVLSERNANALKDLLKEIHKDFQSGASGARQKGRAAIGFYEEKASTEAIAKVLMGFPAIAKRTAKLVTT